MLQITIYILLYRLGQDFLDRQYLESPSSVWNIQGPRSRLYSRSHGGGDIKFWEHTENSGSPVITVQMAFSKIKVYCLSVLYYKTIILALALLRMPFSNQKFQNEMKSEPLIKKNNTLLGMLGIVIVKNKI